MIRAEWRKSSHSAGEQSDCVEVGDLYGAIGVRDSKNPHGAMLEITRGELGTLLCEIKAGRHQVRSTRMLRGS